ncbi:MAG: LysR substrate-binding domain-containing protein [Pseudomonadota bacterium]
MDTDALRLFVSASEMLNISAAGRRLSMAPAVSSAKLAKLEQSVGAELLHRTTRKVSLSLEGEEFLPFAREMIAQEDAAMVALGRGKTKITGTLRFAAPSTFAQQYIVPIVPEFLDQHPDLVLDFRLSDIQFDLIEGSFDLALRNAPISDTSLKGRKLADDTRILCASPAYLKAHGAPKTPSDLRSHSLIAFRDRLPRRLKGPNEETAMFEPAAARSQLIFDDGLSQKRATVAGAGISLNSLWSVHKQLASGELKRVLPEFEGADQNVLWLIYPKSNILSPKVRVFMDFLIARIGKNPDWLKRVDLS